MYYQQYHPCEALKEYIECYWILRTHHAGYSKQRLVPGGRIELIFNFGSDLSWMIDEVDQTTKILKSGVGVMGQRNKIHYSIFSQPLHLVGIRFKPGGLIAFTDIPAMHLLNNLLDAEDVFGPMMNDWKEKILDKKNDDEKIILLDVLMMSAFRKKPADWMTMHSLIDSIRTMDEPVPVSIFCDQAGWNYKKMERSFLKFTGYTPKQYMRIVRFNKALRQIDKNCQSLTATGFDNGYYDQAHFIKEFVKLAGTTPGRLQTGDHTITNLLVKYQPV